MGYPWASKAGASASSRRRAQLWWASTESSGATTEPTSTMIVGDHAMCILSDSLVEQTPIRRQVGVSASDGTDEIAGQIGTAPCLVSRPENQRVLDDFTGEARRRHVAPPRFVRQRGVELAG